MNINGYVCLEFSVIWGILSFSVTHIVQSKLVEVIESAPVELIQLLVFNCILFLAIDIVISMKDLIGIVKQDSEDVEYVHNN